MREYVFSLCSYVVPGATRCLHAYAGSIYHWWSRDVRVTCSSLHDSLLIPWVNFGLCRMIPEGYKLWGERMCSWQVFSSREKYIGHHLHEFSNIKAGLWQFLTWSFAPLFTFETNTKCLPKLGFNDPLYFENWCKYGIFCS